MTTQPISLHFSIVMDADGKVTGIIPTAENEGEHVQIDRAAVKASSRGCVKKSDGEILAKRIRDAMEDRRLTVEGVSKMAKISHTSLYRYLRYPGTAPLAVMLRICKAVGIQQITLQTSGTYYER